MKDCEGIDSDIMGRKRRKRLLCCLGRKQSQKNTRQNGASDWECSCLFGVICECHRFTCFDCLEKILDVTSFMPKQPYHSGLEKAIEIYKREPQHHTNIKVTVCHSCWIDKAVGKVGDKMGEIDQVKDHPMYAGFLYMYEFGILIDPPIVNEPGKHFVDIHAMGTEANSGFPWHSVIDYDAGVKFDEKGFIGGDINSSERVSCKRFELKLPLYIDDTKERDYTVDVITVIEDSHATKQHEGSCVVPEENWDDIVVFTKDNKVEGAHVTLIVGKYIYIISYLYFRNRRLQPKLVGAPLYSHKVAASPKGHNRLFNSTVLI